mmetsp:Transcript_100233/g.176602  ORF Transcript_100233/g.176602 Transcript_100233/m.176602 type:complete len:209 (+) Transcript_100233:1640-2266(+)
MLLLSGVPSPKRGRGRCQRKPPKRAAKGSLQALHQWLVLVARPPTAATVMKHPQSQLLVTYARRSRQCHSALLLALAKHRHSTCPLLLRLQQHPQAICCSSIHKGHYRSVVLQLCCHNLALRRPLTAASEPDKSSYLASGNKCSNVSKGSPLSTSSRCTSSSTAGSYTSHSHRRNFSIGKVAMSLKRSMACHHSQHLRARETQKLGAR